MADCPFCAIARGELDADLVASRTPRTFVVPALRQRRNNLGHVLVLPTAHATSLYDMSSDLRTELFDEVARVAQVMSARLGAHGSTILQNNDSPDQVLFHVHVHVVPRYRDDAYLTPSGPPGVEIPREARVEQAAALRAALRRG
jgi:histidine triad (HIT) family protein